MSRAQVPVTVVEATLGVLLVTAVVFTFALGVPEPDARQSQAQLEMYAADAGTLLATEPPRHADQTRLAESIASEDAFERERSELERRIDRILPPNVLFRLETSHGTVGQPLPDDVPTGETTVLTANGDVTLRVWYA